MRTARPNEAADQVPLTGEQILAGLIEYANALEPKVQADDQCPYERQFFSVGYVCQALQLLPEQLRALAKSAGVRLAMVQNDVGMYDANGLLGLSKHLRELRAMGEMKSQAPNN